MVRKRSGVSFFSTALFCQLGVIFIDPYKQRHLSLRNFRRAGGTDSIIVFKMWDLSANFFIQPQGILRTSERSCECNIYIVSCLSGHCKRGFIVSLEPAHYHHAFFIKNKNRQQTRSMIPTFLIQQHKSRNHKFKALIK